MFSVQVGRPIFISRQLSIVDGSPYLSPRKKKTQIITRSMFISMILFLRVEECCWSEVPDIWKQEAVVETPIMFPFETFKVDDGISWVVHDENTVTKKKKSQFEFFCSPR